MEKKRYISPEMVIEESITLDTFVMLLDSGSAPESGKSSVPRHVSPTKVPTLGNDSVQAF